MCGRTELREDYDKPNLADVRGLASCGGPHDESDAPLVRQFRVVADEVIAAQARMPPVADAQHRCGRRRCARCAQRIDEKRRTTAAARRVRGERQERVERGDGAHGGDPQRVARVEARADGTYSDSEGRIEFCCWTRELAKQLIRAVRCVPHIARFPVAAPLENRRWRRRVGGHLDSIAAGGNLHVAQRQRAMLETLLP